MTLLSPFTSSLRPLVMRLINEYSTTNIILPPPFLSLTTCSPFRLVLRMKLLFSLVPFHSSQNVIPCLNSIIHYPFCCRVGQKAQILKKPNKARAKLKRLFPGLFQIAGFFKLLYYYVYYFDEIMIFHLSLLIYYLKKSENEF